MILRVAFRIAVLSVAWVSTSPLLAQTCSMCKQTAQATGAGSVLNSGILILFIPSVSLMACILAIAYRKRK